MGSQKGVDYLAYNNQGVPINSTAYFASFIANLEAVGYQVGKDLAAAPYDWRRTKDPSGWNGQLKSLVERLYSDNDNTPVYVLCHSMYLFSEIELPGFPDSRGCTGAI
jgi:hypothetical protein